ncbi:hypothetical protein B1813_01915 [Saccharomonospora piscinae]|uniref:Uncharacterized protein n=1 Tax=Saccharomonospora piscinae TaxID=687388 RepID=A0A1V9ACJ8_SACPI|nr:hypothetical protein [Saccharomonospora piscinae]OQO94857.1 hypothetical protein B1813_01915 [Saccharomonospora piscinae]TLW94426.1 hypothetical protein FFT09_00505 [Saccharomonospora piscinae]
MTTEPPADPNRQQDQAAQPPTSGHETTTGRKRTKLFLGLGIAAAVVVGGVVTLTLTLGGGDDEDQVAELADTAVTALNDRDATALADVSCGDIDGEVDPGETGDMTMERAGEVTIDDDTARIPVTMKMMGQEAPFDLVAENAGGDWCIRTLEPQRG